MTDARVTNWAGNVAFRAARFHEPATVEAVQELVAGSARVRALGTGHSFNRIADTVGELVSLRLLPQVLEIDRQARTARVSGASRYGEVGAALQTVGLALPNTGSLPHISIAGACATGTHGSGRANPVLSRSVRALTMVQGDGRLVSLARDDPGDAETFDGSVLALGRLGLVTELTLDVVPTYDVAQSVVRDVPDATVAERLGEILGSAYSVSVFTALEPDRNRVWLKQKVDAALLDQPPGPADLWGGRLAETPQHPIDGIDAESATEQLGVVGPWNERMPHFRLDFRPSAGDELQSEWLVPFELATRAWRSLLGIRDIVRRQLLVSEIRCVAADPMWLSSTAGRDCVAFHFTWRPDPTHVVPVVAEIERRLEQYDARPHWGKVFTVSGEWLRPRYPHMAEFRALVERHDPSGRFGNELVDGWLGIG
ncbi:MAG: FAD-binding protein [Actinomycetales bacterium]